ncbi:MAG: hypothetical protein PVH05_13550 [Burkholderiales bacterium]|jgi:hypothetical protein
MRLAAIVAMLAFTATTSTALAGVTPNNATSTLQRSGAKIAPAKPAPQDAPTGESDDHGGGAK